MFEEELKMIIRKKDYNNNYDDINFAQNFKTIYTKIKFNIKFIFLFVTLFLYLYICLLISIKIKNKNSKGKPNIINQTDIYINNISIINSSNNINIESDYNINKNDNIFLIGNYSKNKEFNISEINNELNLSKLMQFYDIPSNKIINNLNIKLEKENKTKDSLLINNKFLLQNDTIEFINLQEEIKNYYKFNNNNVELDNREYFYEIKEPKISIIITIYNQEIFIKNIYKCIKNQSLKDIEIIFVDDGSSDNSSYVVKELMKYDRRIVYIQNLNNKGQFYSRYRGALTAKGEYVLIIDPDDLLLNNILIKAYDLAILYNLDIVHYYHIKGNLTDNVIRKMNITGNFYQPYIKNIFFNCSYRYLWDKLIKKKIFIESIGFIKEKYRKEKIIIHNDEVACFAVFRIANSYGILEQIGYFYNRGNPYSITKFNFKKQNINGRFHTLFTIMDFYYHQSDDNTFEKINGGYNFFDLRIKFMYETKIKYLTKGFNYIFQVLDLYLNSKFFNNIQKKNLINFKIKINEQKLKIIKNKNNTYFD